MEKKKAFDLETKRYTEDGLIEEYKKPYMGVN
jgi:hypothetical protein